MTPQDTKRKKFYEHENLMQELNLSSNDLPRQLREAYNEFNREDAKVEGYQPLLEPASEELAMAIREWYDEHEDHELPYDANERACFVAFVVMQLDAISPKEFRQLGGKFSPNPKQRYRVANRYRLEPAEGGKAHRIIDEEEEK